LKVTAQGYEGLTTWVALKEKGKEFRDEPGKKQTVTLDPNTRTGKVRLIDIPREPGEKVYEIFTPKQPGEEDVENNRIERSVFVREAKVIKVLYVEGYRRYEYHYVKTLLERESNRTKGNKSIDLKVLLLDADPDYAAEDRSALAEFPTKAELN